MNATRLTPGAVRRLIPRRPRDSQKGENGHVLLVAGRRGMAGAAILSGLGVLKAGAGLLTVALPPDIRGTFTRRLPEAMTIEVREIPSYVRRRTVTAIAIGPGLGVGPSLRALIRRVLKLGLPTVVDADGLNNLRPEDLRGSQTIITPHPGEMARLLNSSAAQVQKDRLRACVETARAGNVITVLKGRHTLVSDGAACWWNPTGTPAMATGGMGDVLTGVIAGLLAQGLSRLSAALAGVYLHGLAGNLAQVSDRGLLASEVALRIPHALRRVGRRP